MRDLATPFCLHPMVDAVPSPETLTIRYPFRPDNLFTLNDVLEGLGLGDASCDLNACIMPTSQPAHRMRPPALERLATQWIPWDSDLSPATRIWLTFTDKDLFREATDVVRSCGNRFGWVAGAQERRQTHVELNLLNTIELVELQSQQHTAINAFQAQILQRDAQVLALQQETRALRQQLARQDQELTAANNRLGAR